MASNTRKGKFELKVHEDEEKMLVELAKYVSARIAGYLSSQERVDVVTPAGGTADKFFSYFAEQLNQYHADFSKVHFYVGEDFYPLDHNHPASFSGRLKRNLADKLKAPANFHYIDPNSSLETNLEMIRDLAERGTDIFIAGLNESGVISALRSGLQWKLDSLNQVYFNLSDTARLNDPEWVYNVHPDISKVLSPEVISRYFKDNKPSHFITHGYLPILKARELIVLGSGKKKRPALERVLSGVGEERDNVQTNSLAEIINSRHISGQYAKNKNITYFYLDSEANPQGGGCYEKG